MKKKKKEELDINSSKTTNKKVGKKHIFRKILLVILIIALLLFIISMINNFITNIKINKFRDNISSIEKEKINYVFIEINPSLVLTMKDGKVSDVACLNDDCIEIYDEIDVKGKSIDDALELSNKAVVEALDGLPTHKIHCSVLAEEAVKAAVKDYYEKNGIEYDKEKFAPDDCPTCGE